MSIFTKTLTGKTITLVVGDSIEIGPRRADGTFLIRTGGQEVYAVSAVLVVNGVSIHLSPPA
jgi:hypothetical protein